MPIHHDRFSNDIPYSAHTHFQPSPTFGCPSILSSSPLASRDDPSPLPASDADYSGHAYTTLDPAEGSLYGDIYNTGSVDSTVPSNCAWQLSGNDAFCGDTGQQNQASGPFWSSIDVGAPSFPGVESYPRESYALDWTGTQAIPLNVEISYRNASTPLWPSSQNMSCSVPESPYCDSSFDDWSPVSSILDAQIMHPTRCDSAGPYSSAMQIMDGHRSVPSSVWDGSSPGSFAESSYSPMYGSPNIAWNVIHDSQSPNMGTISQPSSIAAGTINSDTRDVCARCSKQFAHSADLTRHMKTQHGVAGTGYRCAHPGCPKIGKIWLRLDSFKKHVKKQHRVESVAEVNSLVEKSATGEHGLPISMTSLSRSQVGSPASRIRHSVTL